MGEFPKWKHELPSFPFAVINTPLTSLTEYYREHLRRDVRDSRLQPPDYWVTIRGFLISATQTYSAICILLADKRPKPLMLQAAILCRSLLETLGNLLVLTQAPKSRMRVLVREGYKNHALTYRRLASRYGKIPKWKEYLDVYEKGLRLGAAQIHLSRAWARNPTLIPDRWPTPGVAIYGDKRRNLPPLLRGNRRRFFKEFYDFHYGRQSEQAHQRASAVGVALLVENPEEQWNPGGGESNIVSTAMLFLTCILSEIEILGKFRPHPKLREVWTYLQQLDDEAKDVWKLRYRRLLKTSVNA